ncbi:hypothetical protein ACFXA0_31125 [Streptomyces cyaneofuscatus]|uniref:hypothetical protein n=1 Tax=Streptomyces cyaneofuscatus TaxID=66883 RepID=UPI00368C5416
MTTLETGVPAAAPGRSPVKGWLAVMAVTLGVFSLMTSEPLPVGLLTDATEAATSLYVSAFNLSIALGALFGGFAVDGIGTTSVLWTGAGLTLLALVVVGGARRTRVGA